MCLRPLGRPSSGAMSSHAGIHVLGMLLDSCAMYLLHATLSPAGMTLAAQHAVHCSACHPPHMPAPSPPQSVHFDLRAAVAFLIAPASQSPRLSAAMAASSILGQLCSQATVRGQQLDFEALTVSQTCPLFQAR